jgi:hypothetical protein
MGQINFIMGLIGEILKVWEPNLGLIEKIRILRDQIYQVNCLKLEAKSQEN